MAADGLRRARRADPPLRRPARSSTSMSSPSPTPATWASRSADAPRQGRAARGAELPVLRRPRAPGHGRDAADGHRPPRLHPLRARGRRRGDRAVELPADAGVAGRSRPRWPGATPSCSSPRRTPPRSATIMARLALEAGIPPGVLNVLHGYGPELGGLGAHRGPPGRPDHVHRRVRAPGGSITGAAARNLTPGEPRAGRQGRQPGVRRRRPGHGRRLVDQGDLHQRRARCASRARGSTSQRAVLDEFLARFVAAAERPA